jgi:hypothetical protein
VRLFAFAALCAFTSVAVAAPVIDIEIGKSIEGVTIGMTKSQLEKRGFKLVPENIDRLERVGFQSGALLFLFDTHDTLVSVSLELQKTGGVRIGKIKIVATATMEDVMKRLPQCVLSQGSGGRSLSCKNKKGGEINMYDSYGSQNGFIETVHLGPG